MMGLAIPAFNAIRGGTDFTSEVYSFSGALQQARAYAMANNTYVLVGIEEVSAAQNASATPQVSGTGRIAIAIIASKDGTRPYQSLITTPPSASFTGTNYLTPTGYGYGSAYTAVSNLITLTNIHMVDLQNIYQPSQEPTGGGLVRPWHTDFPPSWPWENYCLGDTSACTAANCFTWPLGSGAASNPPPQYIFSQVIEFDPVGSARIILGDPNGSNGGASSSGTIAQDAIPYFIEIGLEPAKGAMASPPPEIEEPTAAGSAGQVVALQLDGMTGATRTYRP